MGIVRVILLVTIGVGVILCQEKDLADHFKSCKKGSSSFDKCMEKALNSLRHYFKKGLPEYGVGSFDPFFAPEVVQKRGGPNLNYKLKLKNVYEYNWSQSYVDNFRSDFGNHRIIYSQYFPEKYLNGEYEMDGLVLQYPVHNKGFWNLSLYDYNQTTTISRRSIVLPDGKLDYSGPLKVNVKVTHIGNMSLHITNLLRGRPVVEGMLDRMINSAWRPTLPLFTPAVNDLVSTAFTEIFNKYFKRFPFEQIFPD
ncbi:circadian clock-controlled protein daywake [Anabrus simplex]|uniref:circadian clock-controlled protein daywake n=1 Tax=Anabrus simplex TaxID=316456 RepID=UPI0035A33D11